MPDDAPASCMSLHPPHDPGAIVEKGRSGADPVTFIRIDHQTRLEPMVTERAMELHGLARGHAKILSAADAQDRG
jgi:hypothetical protein